MELCLTEEDPGVRQFFVELALLEPRLVFRVFGSIGVGFGFRLYGVEFDTLAALLDSDVHFAGSGFSGFVVGDGIQGQRLAVVVLVGSGNLLQSFVESVASVEGDVVLRFGLVIPA